MNIPVLSFFTGDGFLDLGLEQAGFSVVWTNEANSTIANMYEYAMTEWQRSQNGRSSIARIKNRESIVDIKAAPTQPGDHRRASRHRGAPPQDRRLGIRHPHRQKAHSGAIVSLTERKSRLSLLTKVPSKTAECVKQAILDLLKPVVDRAYTLTSDNSKKFTHHEAIAHALEADFYFVHPGNEAVMITLTISPSITLRKTGGGFHNHQQEAAKGYEQTQ